ncbi:MAG: hypothetical protein QM802_20015 [Agriterribacter sp.]
MKSFTKKRSESLSPEELEQLKEYRTQFKTDVECAASIKIDRNVLSRVILAGSGSPDTVKKVRSALKAAPENA